MIISTNNKKQKLATKLSNTSQIMVIMLSSPFNPVLGLYPRRQVLFPKHPGIPPTVPRGRPFWYRNGRDREATNKENRQSLVDFHGYFSWSWLNRPINTHFIVHWLVVFTIWKNMSSSKGRIIHSYYGKEKMFETTKQIWTGYVQKEMVLFKYIFPMNFTQTSATCLIMLTYDVLCLYQTCLSCPWIKVFSKNWRYITVYYSYGP